MTFILSEVLGKHFDRPFFELFVGVLQKTLEYVGVTWSSTFKDGVPFLCIISKPVH